MYLHVERLLDAQNMDMWFSCIRPEDSEDVDMYAQMCVYINV